MSAEFGVFNGDGCIEAGFWTLSAAATAATQYRTDWDNTDGDEGDPHADAMEICPDHEEQPLDGCEECAAEEDEDAAQDEDEDQ